MNSPFAFDAGREAYCNAPDATWRPESVGCCMRAMLQGAVIFAKVNQGPQVAVDGLLHRRHYLEKPLATLVARLRGAS